MKIAEIFETQVEEKIDPVIKVGELQDEAKLAAEIGSYVVTPLIERYVDEFLEHFTDTFRRDSSEIGVWISGYFGSGKSHLAKILGLLAENRALKGLSAAKRFEARVSTGSGRYSSIKRNLALLANCDTRVLAFNLNTLVDDKGTPLPRLLISQYFQWKGYSSNVLYAKVIERELDRQGKLDALHDEVAKLAGRPWNDIRRNPGFYATHLYRAASNLVPEIFASPQAVAEALKNADRGELYNTQLLIGTVLEDLQSQEHAFNKPCRLLFVLDESGQWIGDDGERLAQLQALVEEAAIKGRGKIWVFVTTHEDMGSVYLNARALAADMKKIEGRFRFKFPLTTENIELVLEDRILRKKIAGRDAVRSAYETAPGIIRGLGELANVDSRQLPGCDLDKFVTFYPFFPYQVHLIPEIVKGLRSKGGRTEALSGSTRTMLAITQDILRVGRRDYLACEVGELVSFDEVYYNLSGEGEVGADIRRELSQIDKVVPGATPLTRRIAEVLFLVDELKYVPRTIDNIARFLVESTSDELPVLRSRIEPELERLIKARAVTRIGDEYEFLTGERRSFEDEVATVEAELRYQDREVGLARHFVYDANAKKNHLRSILDFETVEFKGAEFAVRLGMDGTAATRNGDVQVHIFSPLAVSGGAKISDLENQSLRSEEQNTIFVLSDRVPGFDRQLGRFLATREIIDKWKSDTSKSDAARKLALDRESNDLPTLERTVRENIKDSLKQAHVVFRGSSHSISPKLGQSVGEALRGELASFFPSIYPKFDRVPVRIINEQTAVRDVLAGEKNLSGDVKALKLFDQGGALDPRCPLVDAIKILLSSRQQKKERVLGGQLVSEFIGPPYGWDPNAVRVAVAACIRSGIIKPLIGKMPHPNPNDPALQNALRVSREFDRLELVLEEAEIDQSALEEIRTLLIKLTGKRKIEETPAALHEAIQAFVDEQCSRANKIIEWSHAAGFPRPSAFDQGKELLDEVLALSNPVHRLNQVRTKANELREGVEAIEKLWAFYDRWRIAFVEVRTLAEQLRAIEHLLPPTGQIRSFLDAYESALERRRFAEPDIWKSVQNSKAAAALELESVLSQWRDEAGKIANDALARLPDDLNQHDLDHGMATVLGQRLKDFAASLDNAKEPARVAALPQRARQLVADLGVSIQKERDKVTAKKVDGPNGGVPRREVKHLRLLDLTTVRLIRTETEWETVARKMDEQVRRMLRDFEVELE